ncbi:MAG: TIGR03617 family F420-dependent LLM class oxidoreductase [Anaerolineales bacterium]|nr:TIGR03617 family F420-dependent LLM class oxidoreductase [Anaerolineales bacterium]
MKFDAVIPPTTLRAIPEIAESAEKVGFDALWSTETQHDPFLPLALIAEHSQKLELGTAVAIAFARNPANLAYTSWDLAQASGGRFILGLGTQVKAHIERRFGMSWPESPVGKLREQINAVRAIWDTWQHGEKLNFRGVYHKHTIMTPFFNPGPIQHPEIPIYIAGVNTGLCRLAGELADGFHIHPFHSVRYLQDIVIPAIIEGTVRSDRSRSEIQLSASVMAATDEGEMEFVRSQISFYASTPSYRAVMEVHGWGEVADELRALSRRGEWVEMASLITDEMLSTFAVIADEDDLASELRSRYGSLIDRITLYHPFVPGERDSFWSRIGDELRSSA